MASRLIKVQFRRRRENKTDYLARRKLLEGRTPRVVVRKTNRYIIAELVESSEAQDKVVCSANSKELTNYGLGIHFSIKNIPSAYLTGFLLGKKMKQKKYEDAILDLGLIRSTKGSKIYAALKGLIDAGINIPHSEEIFPSKDRIEGKHVGEKVRDNLAKVKGEIEKIK